jgi:hypothetical protein
MDDSHNEAPPLSLPAATDQVVATAKEAALLTKLSQSGGIVQSPKSQAMLELEETGIRGGGMILLRVIVAGLEEDLRRERIISNTAKQESDTWREKYFEEKEKAVVLQTQIEALTRLKILQNVFLSVGGVFGGLGAKLLVDDKYGFGGLFLLVGVFFLFAGWLWPTGFRNKSQSKEQPK